jgi:hypothetical protein
VLLKAKAILRHGSMMSLGLTTEKLRWNGWKL